ncbi:unnamed protein product [Prorocentrum cordatum]|uniref:Uncharacterized protein n=1 Tax=Prorocentrum cordatum TaxID=2364126 RepID=A0ABN9T3I8_9DINO|nr:unnamed protein product [Polarella glacialis]
MHVLTAATAVHFEVDQLAKAAVDSDGELVPAALRVVRLSIVVAKLATVIFYRFHRWGGLFCFLSHCSCTYWRLERRSSTPCTTSRGLLARAWDQEQPDLRRDGLCRTRPQQLSATPRSQGLASSALSPPVPCSRAGRACLPAACLPVPRLSAKARAEGCIRAHAPAVVGEWVPSWGLRAGFLVDWPPLHGVAALFGGPGAREARS